MGPGVPVAAVAVDLLWRIWSECYLGRRLFESVWSEPPRFVDADGAIYREQLVTDRSALDRHWPAGSGTTWLAERARHEALVLMSLHGLAGRFERIIWDGDCRQPPDVSTFRRDSSAAFEWSVSVSSV